MAFFRNDAINRVNIHFGVHAFAAGAGGVFYFAYLLNAGLSVPATLVTFATILVGRFALRPLALPLARRWGLRPMVLAGALTMTAPYLLLPLVHGVGWPLVALVVVSAASDTWYWPSYHAYFAAIGDAEHRGHQIGAREALAAVVGIAAPLVGGWALQSLGAWWTFGAVALVQAASALPLLGAPNVQVAARAPGAWRAARPGLALVATDGWFGATYYFVWLIMLFVSLGRNVAAYGGAMALAALVGAVIGLFFGRHIDRGHGRRAALLAYLVTAVVIVLRAASLGSPWLAVVANASGALVGALVTPAMGTAVYNLAKASPCPFRFSLATEGAWDVGCAAGILASAGLAAIGVSLSFAMLLALPAAGAASWLLWRYYGAHPADPAVAIEPRLAGEPL